MGDLEKLLQRTTIEFGTSITFEEIEKQLFKYLIQKMQVHERWQFSGQGYESPEEDSRERHIDKVTLQLTKRNDPMSSGVFEFQTDEEDYRKGKNSFKAMRLATYVCDSIEEVLSLPSGEGQLELTDEVRKTVDSYFSERSKRSK